MPKTWPPPPDLVSIRELVANADIEGFITTGAPADEYDTEAEQILAAIEGWPTADLTTERLLPVIEKTWSQNFSLALPALEDRRIELRKLAGEIERFFGPGARPQVRGA